MSKPRRRYVVCVHTEGAEDLELRKLYEVREDETAERQGHLCVVDESGEDYPYPNIPKSFLRRWRYPKTPNGL